MRSMVLVLVLVGCTSDVGYQGATGVGNPGSTKQTAARGQQVAVAGDQRDVLIGNPELLVDQLRPGGRMMIPLGGTFGQDLVLVSKAQSVRSSRMMMGDLT